jgi:hypothetical protein
MLRGPISRSILQSDPRNALTSVRTQHLTQVPVGGGTAVAGGAGGYWGSDVDVRQYKEGTRAIIISEKSALREQLLSWAAIESFNRVVMSHGAMIDTGK